MNPLFLYINIFLIFLLLCQTILCLSFSLYKNNFTSQMFQRLCICVIINWDNICCNSIKYKSKWQHVARWKNRLPGVAIGFDCSYNRTSVYVCVYVWKFYSMFSITNLMWFNHQRIKNKQKVLIKYFSSLFYCIYFIKLFFFLYFCFIFCILAIFMQIKTIWTFTLLSVC